MALAAWVVLHLAPAAIAAPDSDVLDRPRRNVRVAFAMGQGALMPPACSDCVSFWGRSLSFGVEVGATLRPDLVISLEEQLNVIHFADNTDGITGGLQLSALYFFRPRTWLVGGGGVGFRQVSREQMTKVFPEPKEWSHAGVLITAGVGHEIGRRGAFAIDAQARATAVMADALAPGILLLIGVAWN
jgi:hypothetical protein